MFMLVEIVAYLIVLVAAMSSNGPAVANGLTQVNLTKESSYLTTLGQAYAHLCNDTQHVCKDVATGNAVTSGAAPVEAGYVPVVPTPPIGAGSVFDIAVAAQPSNSAANVLVVYATKQIDGAYLQEYEAYTVTANGTQPPTVADNGKPAKGTTYTLVYDTCTTGLYVTTATTPTSVCS